MASASDARRYSPSAARNRAPVTEVLKHTLPARGLVLEIASGTGEHAVHFAQRLPQLVWQPSDPDTEARVSIAAWVTAASLANLRGPLDLDVTSAAWPISHTDAIVCLNMIHIAPWTATEALMRGAARILPQGGVLYLYGPYKQDGRHTAPSNEAFDRDLQRRNPEWGVRDIEAVVATAQACGLGLHGTVQMPANNLSVILKRQHTPVTMALP